MSAAPRCTSWLGHKFEARYSSRPSGRIDHIKSSNYADVKELLEADRVKTYELDICVRCGQIVQKFPYRATYSDLDAVLKGHLRALNSPPTARR